MRFYFVALEPPCRWLLLLSYLVLRLVIRLRRLLGSVPYEIYWCPSTPPRTGALQLVRPHDTSVATRIVCGFFDALVNGALVALRPLA